MPRPAPAALLCQASADAVASGPTKGDAIVATVTRVDPNHGQFEFTTQTGSFLLTTPAEIRDLHVGDQLLFCLHEDGSESADRVVEDTSTAPAQPQEARRDQTEPTPEPRTTPLEAGQGESRQ